MGNCQAVDAAALVIQHPCGKIDRLYWPVTASEVMRANPGHYVSLIIPLQVPQQQNQDQNSVRITQVKLLRPNELLTLGHAYRLVTTQEVVKVLRAKKHAKTRKPQAEAVEKSQSSANEAEGQNSHSHTATDGVSAYGIPGNEGRETEGKGEFSSSIEIQILETLFTEHLRIWELIG